MTAHAPPRGPFLHPVSLGLILLLAFHVLLVERVLRRLPTEFVEESNKRVFKDFLRRESGADSWYPMTIAYQFHLARPGEPIYAHVFFEDRVKFQYPPSSLLVWRVLHLARPAAMEAAWFEGGRYREAQRVWWGGLDAAMWACVWIVAALGAAIFDVAWRAARSGEDGALRARDRLVAAVAVFGLGLYYYPMLRTYTLGQIQAALTGLGAVAVFCWLRGWRAAAGALFGLVCLVKPQAGLVLVWALVRREWRVAAGFAATALPFGVWSLAEFGWSNHVEYLGVLGFIARHGEGYFPNQSVNGLLVRALGLGNNLEWEGGAFPPYHALVAWGTLLSSLAMVCAALWTPRRRDDAGWLADFLLLLVVATLASPVAWEHHYGILVPILAAATPMLLRDRPLGRATAPLLVAAFLVSAHLIGAAKATAATPFNVVQSYLFAAGLAIMAMLLATKFARPGAAPPEWTSRSPS